MQAREVKAKSILRKYKKIDSWFLSRYGLNLYRGCAHNCVYCDGRDPRYGVTGEFHKEIDVKVNALELLDRELNPYKKRTPWKKAFLFLGGGVNDAYQPLEKKYNLSRGALELFEKYSHPVHVLTKSTLVTRDMDILKRIKERSGCLISMSFSSIDEKISALLEPGVPSPEQRLEVLAHFKEQGFGCGIYLMPVVPCVTDAPHLLDKIVGRAKSLGLDYVIMGAMTLKPGLQADYFHSRTCHHFPSLLDDYTSIYPGDPYGSPSSEYYESLSSLFLEITRHYRMPPRIPLRFYKNILGMNDLVVVLLEHLDFFRKAEGQQSPYGYAAYNVSQLKEDIRDLQFNLKSIKGVGPGTAQIIREILREGTLKSLEKYAIT